MKYSSGCDSLIRVVELVINPVVFDSGSATICAGQHFTLPWGTVVTSAGLYRDTARYINGCDSLVRVINLRVQVPVINIISATICEGNSYQLPWGTAVNSSGVYSDTIKYASGCDSLIRTINLNVDAVARINLQESICSGQTFALPSGTIVSEPGLYVDTLVNSRGCDSIITHLDLEKGSAPLVSINKSNDITCSLGVTKLNANGGIKYVWWPANSLDNANSSTPNASPVVTTVYHVKVTGNDGCVGEDSISVNVLHSPSANDIVMPNAFSPNNDGVNDCFGVKHLGRLSDLRFSIYNRWGNLIFFTSNSAECWDGMYKGVMQPVGEYVYILRAQTICGLVHVKGLVMLLR